MNVMSGVTPQVLSYQIAGVLDIKPSERQQLLAEPSVKGRLEKESGYLSKEVQVLELEKKIATKTQEKFEKNVKEQVLRERIKTIEKELGKTTRTKIQKSSRKSKKANMPIEVREKAEKEIKRLAQMSPYNPEASYVRTYVDWLIELPWSVETPNDVVIAAAEKVLHEDHYGLAKIKERILEYLAVMKLRAKRAQEESSADEKSQDIVKKNKAKSSPTILCFVGPLGVGKTSIGKSIARSMGRKFVKMSLGACAMKRKYEVIDEHTWEPCRDALSRVSNKREPKIRYLCSMRSIK